MRVHPLHNFDLLTAAESLASDSSIPSVRRSRSCQPELDPREIRDLAVRHGQPLLHRVRVESDDHLRAHRWREAPDRRGEVVFAIRQPGGQILLHTKPHYEQPIYRLPTGGIGWNERVEDALLREVAEETGQPASIRRFVSVVTCDFVHGNDQISFTSYLFYLQSPTAELRAIDSAEIGGYRTVDADQLEQVARELRGLTGRRRCWGQWRSLPHDVFHRFLLSGHDGAPEEDKSDVYHVAARDSEPGTPTR